MRGCFLPGLSHCGHRMWIIMIGYGTSHSFNTADHHLCPYPFLPSSVLLWDTFHFSLAGESSYVYLLIEVFVCLQHHPLIVFLRCVSLHASPGFLLGTCYCLWMLWSFLCFCYLTISNPLTTMKYISLDYLICNMAEGVTSLFKEAICS